MSDAEGPEMTSDLARRTDLPAVGTESVLALIARAASNPAIDVEKMQALLDMHREIEARQSEREYNIALNLAQAEIEPIARTTENTQTRSFYAKLEDIDDKIRAVYVRHGFSLSFDTVAPIAAGNIRIECRCHHVGGHTARYGREAPADTLGPKGAPVKTQLHGAASTETYLKRYITCGIFNVVFRGQDDDGVRGGMEFIDAPAVKQLDDLLRRTRSNFDDFCRVMGVRSLVDIQVQDYPRAVNAVMAKLVRQGETHENP
jgi:hypothetical protein